MMKMGTEFWAAHVAAIQRELIPASEYARQHGLAVKSLYYWRRKLKKSDTTDIPLPNSKFVALRIAPGVSQPRTAHWRCRLACCWSCQRCQHLNGSLRWCMPYR